MVLHYVTLRDWEKYSSKLEAPYTSTLDFTKGHHWQSMENGFLVHQDSASTSLTSIIYAFTYIIRNTRTTINLLAAGTL